MTGRGAGGCGVFAAPGDANPAQFPGELGCGFGRGFRRMYRAAGTPGWACCGLPAYTGTKAAFDEKTFLSNQAEFLERRLLWIKNRLSSLNDETE